MNIVLIYYYYIKTIYLFYKYNTIYDFLGFQGAVRSAIKRRKRMAFPRLRESPNNIQTNIASNRFLKHNLAILLI